MNKPKFHKCDHICNSKLLCSFRELILFPEKNLLNEMEQAACDILEEIKKVKSTEQEDIYQPKNHKCNHLCADGALCVFQEYFLDVLTEDDEADDDSTPEEKVMVRLALLCEDFNQVSRDDNHKNATVVYCIK